MKKYLFVFSTLLIFCSFTSEKSKSIPTGEKLIYAGSYNMSGLMTQLAQVTLSTDIVTTSKKSYLHLNCELETFSKWDRFFKIRDLYEAYVDPATLKPSLYKRSVDEGGWTKTEKYVFKNNIITSTVKRKNKPEKVATFSINPATQDVVSLMYKLRMLDVSKLKNGQSMGFRIVFDEEEIPVTVKMLGRESVHAGNLGEKECYKLSIGAKTDVLKGKDRNLIYLTSDSKKIPVLMKFSIPVGTGQLTLTSASGI
ncbi:DUF3108 domain-containing protein [Flavobacterium aciduliphilum]|uniref:Uncharacterized protein DUF3108 n=1 Tax=Flavobacterium aciduliphilum TaxID=1101402 RepID=A0A328YHN5_9FLAO|nr:DUF3108 domain-containing protein [Flavobacterium aciduliphilum]RAR72794.1 uncharacterized protein DUF3108 [Flavobacterium aciduliphilum]